MVMMESERLILRDYKETDLNDMHGLWSDKKTMYFLNDMLTHTMEDTDASRKVMERAGFRKEGERIKAQYHDGVMKDRLEYAINKDEFINNAKGGPYV